MITEYRLSETLVRVSTTTSQIPYLYRKLRLPFPDTQTQVVYGEWGGMIIQTAMVGGQFYSELYIDSQIDTEFTVTWHEQVVALHAVYAGTTHIKNAEVQVYLRSRRQFLHCFRAGSVFTGSVTAGQAYHSVYITVLDSLLVKLSGTYTKLAGVIACAAPAVMLPFAKFGVTSRNEVKRMKSCLLEGPARETYLQNRISDYLIIYLELIHRTEAEDSRSIDAHNKAIDDLISLINLHPDINIVVAEQAAKIGISQKLLEQAFKNKQGVNVLTYVRLQRLNKAKQLLIGSTFSVADISVKVGYADQSYFTRIFKQETGRTPSEYRIANSYKG